jgi:peptide/nickel transport system substrate-binding protein
VARVLRATALIVVVLTILGAGWWIAARRPRSADSTVPAATGPVSGGTLVVSLRSEPTTYNRHVAPSAAVDALSQLTQAKLVRINRVTGEPEPSLAERWSTSEDGRTFTLSLRKGVTFSDGAPFTSADVLFSFQALYDPSVDSVLASGVKVKGQPLKITAPDEGTVVITLPAPFAPGIQLLDNVPILPRHQLQAALTSHTFRDAWGLKTAPGSMAGLGPFVISEHVPGQRIALTKNPHYWRRDGAGTQLPYLDRVVFEIIPTQDAEILRLQAGSIDLMSQADLRAEDYASLKRLRDQGSVSLVDVGTGVDPNLLWFNLAASASHARPPYLQRPEFRQAISYAVDRDAIVKTVYLGAAVPVFGPVTPGNRVWYSDSVPTTPLDPARARSLLSELGLVDRTGDGMLEDRSGAPVRFSILTQRGNVRERTATVIQEQLRQIGMTVDVVPLDVPSIFQRWSRGDYDSIYYGFQASSLDPANNLDFWLSSGSTHVWNPTQTSPSTPWEQSIDDLMQQQAAAPTLGRRQRLFVQAQKVFAEQLPGIYFVAPRISIAMSRRVGGAQPALLDPKVLWSADTLYVTTGGSGSGSAASR